MLVIMLGELIIAFVCFFITVNSDLRNEEKIGCFTFAQCFLQPGSKLSFRYLLPLQLAGTG